MSKKSKNSRRSCYSDLMAKLKVLKPGGCVSVPIQRGSNFSKMYNILGVVINYAKVEPHAGHYFRKIQSKDGRKVIIHHAKKEDSRGIPLRKAKKVIKKVVKAGVSVDMTAVDEAKRRQHYLNMKRARQARYRKRLKARKEAAAK